MLEELERISKETLAWDIVRMTQKHFGDSPEQEVRKMEAFLGGFIINAASELYERGMKDVAFAKLAQAQKILEAKEKLASEVEAIKAKVTEDAVDLSDILGLFDE